RRFLKEDGVMLPVKSVTKIAAAVLPRNISHNPGFSGVPGKYVENIFRYFGYHFDLRLCIRNFPRGNVISNEDIFEDLDFSAPVAEESRHPIHFVINQNATMDGFLVWLTLHTVEDEVIDTLEHEYCWLPVYVPVFFPGVDVSQGDIITGQCIRTLCENKINPDFKLKGIFKRQYAEDIPFSYAMPHFERTHRGTPFYRKLFANDRINIVETGSTAVDAGELRSYVSKRLPPHMVPSFFVEMGEIPLTPNGKVDRNAFSRPGEGAAEHGGTHLPPQNKYQRLLLDIWRQVLRIGKIGIDDDFFTLGGDSIKALQVVSRLQKNKLRLEANRLFANKTIRRTSKYIRPIDADLDKHRVMDQGVIRGPVGLTPIQRWLFREHPDTAGYFSQSVTLFREQGFDKKLLERTFVQIITHHDALRMTYHRDRGKVIQENLGIDVIPFRLETVHLPTAGELGHILEREIQRLEKSVDWQKGPLIRAALLKGLNGDYLVIVIHHLVVDGVSWRILLEDLEDGYRQLSKRKAIVLPDKTTSFQRWSKTLSEYAGNWRLLRELPYWKAIEETYLPPLPRDRDIRKGKRVFHHYHTLSVEFTEEETRLLTGDVHRAYNTDINDILLTAVGLSIHRWAGVQTVGIDLEGHGRETIGRGIDIHRTVGWFTSLYPVILEMSAGQDLSLTLRRVKETLRRIPVKGLGHGALKYLTPARKKATLHFDLKPEISFNYMGQFDGENASIVKMGGAVNPEFETPYLITIEGVVQNGRLSFLFYYNHLEYDESTVRRLVDQFENFLLAIMGHCLEKENGQPTPSDLGYLNMPVETLPELAAEVNHGMDREVTITAVYPLTPLQKTMYFETQRDNEAYFIQNVMAIPAATDHKLLETGFNRLVERHDVLRTLFIHGLEGLEEPVQVVVQQGSPLKIPGEDIAYLSSEGQRQALEEFKNSDKGTGFDLARGPLMRLVRFKTGLHSDHLVWSLHHIIMDGWCLGIVVSELTQIYEALVAGVSPVLEAPLPYRTYIDWLEDGERKQTLEYWHRYLRGYTQESVLSQFAHHRGSDRFRLAEYYFAFDEALSTRLKQTASGHQVTLSSLFQTFWGMLLHRYTGTRDVVFGTVVSGRSLEVEEVESMVGLFINIVPVRVKAGKSTDFSTLLKRVHQQSVKSRSFEISSFQLGELLLGSSSEPCVIDSIMIFENYPEYSEELEGGFHLRVLENHEHMGYDFCFYVLPGDRIRFRFSYNELVYDDRLAEGIASDFKELVNQLPTGHK
ncbi:MAG: hypothetical protein GY940_10735, partial [bacterium]|nr:hypothetical protein [bacterium]